MVEYTLLNLRKDVEDMAAQYGMGDGIEAHFGRQALGLRKSGLSYLKLGPDYTLPFGHTHAEQEEVYVIVSGSARLKLDDEEVVVGPLDAVRIPEGMTHGIAAGPEGAEVLMFGAPNTENKDVEMVKGFFSD